MNNNPSPIAQWRNYPAHNSLQAQQCCACKKIFYPKTYLCSCGKKEFEHITLSGKGTLLTFTRIHQPPTLYQNMAPYCVGIIQLEEGIKILAQITDVEFESLYIGMPMLAVFRKMFAASDASIITYGTKFVPSQCEQ